MNLSRLQKIVEKLAPIEGELLEVFMDAQTYRDDYPLDLWGTEEHTRLEDSYFDLAKITASLSDTLSQLKSFCGQEANIHE